MLALRFAPDGSVAGELIPTAQSPFWRPHQTTLLDEASAFEQRVFARFFAERALPVEAA